MEKKPKSMREKLPGSLLACLKEQGLLAGKEEILYQTAVDMNTAGEYADGYILVAGERLIVAQLPPDKGRVHILKGYGDLAPAEGTDWVFRAFAVSALEGIWVEDCVGCSLLVARLEGEEIPLAALSNFRKRSVFDFARAVEGYARDGEYKPQREELEDYCPRCGRMYPNPNYKVCPHCVNRKSIFLRTLRYFKPYWRSVLIMFLCILATSALNMVWPYLNGTVLYDRVLAKDEGFLRGWEFREGISPWPCCWWS